jgi:hypothetical protein
MSTARDQLEQWKEWSTTESTSPSHALEMLNDEHVAAFNAASLAFASEACKLAHTWTLVDFETCATAGNVRLTDAGLQAALRKAYEAARSGAADVAPVQLTITWGEPVELGSYVSVAAEADGGGGATYVATGARCTLQQWQRLSEALPRPLVRTLWDDGTRRLMNALMLGVAPRMSFEHCVRRCLLTLFEAHDVLDALAHATFENETVPMERLVPMYTMCVLDDCYNGFYGIVYEWERAEFDRILDNGKERHELAISIASDAHVASNVAATSFDNAMRAIQSETLQSQTSVDEALRSCRTVLGSQANLHASAAIRAALQNECDVNLYDAEHRSRWSRALQARQRDPDQQTYYTVRVRDAMVLLQAWCRDA